MNSTTMKRSASAAADEVRAQAEGLTDDASSMLSDGVGRLRNLSEAASDWAADAAGTLSDRSLRGYRTAEDVIRTQPVLAVGAALLVGLAVGALLLSRRD
jgi:ElaB/YqjD/DUF883 family membrane-anchored ribosome-binding protein